MNFRQINRSVILFLLVSFLNGCNSLESLFLSRNKNDSVKPFQVARTSEEYFDGKENLDAAFSLLEAEKYEEALAGFRNFVTKYPSSPFIIQANFGIALSYEGLGQWTEALANHIEITNRAASLSEHEVVAQSFYKIALCYEHLGNNELSLAALLDANSRSAYLPIELGKAELPARIGAAYLKLDQPELAEAYFQKAEKAIRSIKQMKFTNRDPNWLGKTLIKMGTVSLNQLSEENFAEIVSNLSRVQKYLLQAIEEADANSSKNAEIELQLEYSTLVKFIENIQPHEFSDWQRALVEKSERQNKLAILLLESSEKLKLYILPEELPRAKKTSEIPTFLAKLEQRLIPFTYNQNLILPLTPEAQKLQSIRRQVRFMKVDDSLLKESGSPAGSAKELPKKKKKDPNL